MSWRPKEWKNPCIEQLDIYTFEAGADAILNSLLSSGIITISELEALSKNGDDKRKPQ